MSIDPNGRNVQGITTFILFVILNLAYIVCCLPVVTIGAATSALYEVTLRYADHERGDLVRGFFRAFAANFWRATAVFAMLAVPAAMLSFSAVFWLSTDGILTAVAGGLSILATCFFSAAALYGLALVAWFDAPLRHTVRNALLLPLVEPARTLLLMLLPVGLGSLMYAVPQTVVLVATIGFSVGAYVSALVLHDVFRRRQADPSELEPISPHSGQ